MTKQQQIIFLKGKTEGLKTLFNANNFGYLAVGYCETEGENGFENPASSQTQAENGFIEISKNDDGTYGGVERSDYVYMAIPFEKTIEMDTLALYLHSEDDVSVYISVYITDYIPSNFRGPEDIIPDDEDTSTNTETEIDTKFSGKSDTSHDHNDLYDPKGSAEAVKNDLLNGAGAAYDTLKELGDLIDDNVDAIEALETVAAGKADAVHTHSISEVDGLQDTLDILQDQLNGYKIRVLSEEEYANLGTYDANTLYYCY